MNAGSNQRNSEVEEAVVQAASIGSVGDLTAADEQLRHLAEAIGGNGTPSGFRNAADGSLVFQPLQKFDERNSNNGAFMLPTFSNQGGTESQQTYPQGHNLHRQSTGTPKRRSRLRRRNSAGAKKGTKYTLIDLVDNINTDVKSDVADFDF